MKKNQSGFSLIEVVVSIGIIAVMVLLYFAMFSSVSLAKHAKNRDIALKIANHEMESLRGLGYDALPASGSFSDASLSSLTSGAGSVAVSAYNAQTKEVTVTVTWNESSGSQSVSLSTLIVNSGGLH
jgi:prepilin-type N-terminal cleavage/methylation domain-containing protein